MNEMPVPSGSWAEHHNAKQRAYNLHLMIGVAVTIATVFVVSFSFGYAILLSCPFDTFLNSLQVTHSVLNLILLPTGHSEQRILHELGSRNEEQEVNCLKSSLL